MAAPFWGCLYLILTKRARKTVFRSDFYCTICKVTVKIEFLRKLDKLNTAFYNVIR
jgi:hypothetical protein